MLEVTDKQKSPILLSQAGWGISVYLLLLK